MQMDAYLKMEQIGTLFVRGREGGGQPNPNFYCLEPL